MLHEYRIEILANDGSVPFVENDPMQMKIAKMDNAWRQALKG
jgi:hypothetical protein